MKKIVNFCKILSLFATLTFIIYFIVLIFADVKVGKFYIMGTTLTSALYSLRLYEDGDVFLNKHLLKGRVEK